MELSQLSEDKSKDFLTNGAVSVANFTVGDNIENVTEEAIGSCHSAVIRS
jgi:hypothetical protein